MAILAFIFSFFFSIVSLTLSAKADINQNTIKEFSDNSVSFYKNLETCTPFSENNSKIIGIDSDYCLFSRPDTTSYDLRSERSVNLNACKIPMSLMPEYSQNLVKAQGYLAKSNFNPDEIKESKKAQVEEIQKELFEINYSYCK